MTNRPVGRDLTRSLEPWIEQLSWKPRAYLYHNFLTAADADHLVAIAKPFMQRSTVVGLGGKSVLDNVRTSYGTFLRRYQDPVVAAMEERLASWTKLNITHQEDTQILRYGPGQKYGAHYDSLDNDSPRTATVLVYLADTEEGGETAFPTVRGAARVRGSEWVDPALEQRLGPFSSCAQGSVAARPRKGDALLFHSLKPDGTHDPAAMHTGCPVVKGTKWTATKWIHTKPFRPEGFPDHTPLPEIPVPEICSDRDERCPGWVESGQCSSNSGFMVGDMFQLGACRKSCGACKDCEQGDVVCLSENREKAGFLPLNLETGKII
ncbi:Prolyl 4-hydroxylase subunit alpha-1 [Auxenochlorella protothecoides]|uniref:Prolyl 4-hydroxylase subunit alpha-1 n=1 Tax=Auxenochlorella protothecoides TaxID=3075 RepID=A0A087SE79_AUXPR|nr:Prolyl 4-hydroxylase subunit alpha-1 [Auxenochlorella protothecoides]KFM24033.1 Prolyl 4-hydroxylase subunit alpha-1 [Auxenochlorella protothecoides]RMZ53741.1 hypothetical protein APUTEX25_003880 [Auxenochlorella protothecoides]|eukprot:RMZ53741.1 hypothetical protein APUTEX25_003880 [Auxenochlorella protothecoides]